MSAEINDGLIDPDNADGRNYLFDDCLPRLSHLTNVGGRMKGTLAAAVLVILVVVSSARAQFADNFNGNKLVGDKSGVNGWACFTGDGTATMDLSESGNGYASILVDATKDKRGIWWALIKRRVSRDMDLGLLAKPNYELRIEAKIRVSDAPKRVNLSSTWIISVSISSTPIPLAPTRASRFRIILRFRISRRSRIMCPSRRTR
ncbi:MAG: hypothetical protein B7Z63_06875 [Ignavibacteriae bacterium 37-53-5]|nr:MAG: hypothetical protein B7Z63_06875 [Ignavibacteriae bacterium 37-53-5]